MGWILLFAATAAVAGEPLLSGSFRLAEPPDQVTEKHTGAIERAVSSLPWAFRPFARPRLEGAVNNCAKVELDLASERFRARCDAEPAFEMPRGAEHAITGDDGKRYDVDLTVTDTQATLQFEGEEGGQRTTYAPQPDGSLLLTKELFSPHLPEPVRWTVLYRPAE
jgi:hypothetical protein